MNDITQAQAQAIYDIESYKEITGAKRFKRTKEEVELGLSAEEALQRRLERFKGNEPPFGAAGYPDNAVGKKPKKRVGSGVLEIRIAPEKGVDTDYFEQLPKGRIQITLDEKWYAWLHTKLNTPYEGDLDTLISDILNLGIGEVITQKNFTHDL